MADGELDVKLVPDKKALEDIEDQNIGLSGNGGNAEDIKDLNEEQAGSLAVVGRTLGRLAPIAGKIALVASLLGIIAKVVGGAFNIGFEDVRNAIVNAINTVVSAITGLPGNITSGLENALTFNIGGGPSGGGTDVVAFNPTASLLKNELMGSSTQQQSSRQTNVNLVTSRENLLGDSTMRELETDSVNRQIFSGGS